MIISCPNCGTKYQVAYEAIGATGRKVQCAQCRQAWQASPVEQSPAPLRRPVLVQPPSPSEKDDSLFDSVSEIGLDDAFAEEEQAVAVIMAARRAATEAQEAAENPIQAEASQSRQSAGSRDWVYSRRQAVLFKQLPIARVRRLARSVALLVLIALVGTSLSLRTQIVGQFPELAPIYEALGLGVNVVGLEFRDLETVISHHRGAKVMEVEAKIVSISDRPVPVPQVLVTLLDSHGVPNYEWSVVPDAPDMEPGELLMFKTQVTAPPAGAESVRLTFSNIRNRPLPSRPVDAKSEKGEQ